LFEENLFRQNGEGFKPDGIARLFIQASFRMSEIEGEALLSSAMQIMGGNG
jgi:hypothetical protein